MPSSPSNRDASKRDRAVAPEGGFDRSLAAANLRRSVDERLRRHDLALNDLLALRAAVREQARRD